MTQVVEMTVQRLTVNEGFRAHAYKDTKDNITIGYGFNIGAGISQYAAQELLVAQVFERTQALLGYWWAKELDDARMSVIVEVSFNVGLEGLLHYTETLSALGRKDWQKAHDELLDSDAARELPARYQRLAQLLLTGVD